MKKMLKPEIEFVRFDADDIITTSVSKYDFAENEYVEGENAQDGYGGVTWNVLQ